jgi:hypothetical protein
MIWAGRCHERFTLQGANRQIVLMHAEYVCISYPAKKLIIFNVIDNYGNWWSRFSGVASLR